MSNKVEVKATEYVQAHGRKKRWQKLVTALASVVVFCTTYALIMPAVTMQSDTYCGYEEHEHTDKCYEETLTLICTLSKEGHVHNDDCYGEPELICGREETAGHTHSDDCYSEQVELVCTLEETEGHTHGDECWDTVLACENEEPDHEHGDECYEKVLICKQEEREAHQHGEGCYEKVLICGLEECEPELICGLEEQEPHEHNDKCWKSTIDKEKLICEKEEHKHTLQCYSSPGVDLESPEIWKNSVSSAVLSGKWNEDVIAVAKTQLGYHESTANYEVQEDGTTMKGITRYGQWYGIPYGDWCAMFCSFCIEYAGVEDFPLDCGCRTWITTLDRLGLYHSAEDYEPKPGDLIFFDFDPIVEGVERLSDHVGLVYELEKDENGVPVKLTTIEGNYGDKVSRVEYLPDDEHILGFGEMIENPDYVDPNAVPEEIFAVPECDCGSPNAELLGHSDKCARKAFVMTLCGEKSAEELHELWKQLPEDAQIFAPTYLSWIDQTKLAALNELRASDPVEALAADGNISATITGVFPADAEAALQNLDENSNDLVKNYIENKLGGIDGGLFSGAVDVGLYENGEKLDLNGETVRVTVSGFDFDGMCGDELLVKAYHLKNTDAADIETLAETEPEIELIPASVDENGNIVFETDGFSVIYFTVDFHYLGSTYILPGRGNIMLSNLFAELGLDFDPALIESVEFSDEALLEIIPVYGEDGETVIDWELNSLLPFGSQETLTVTFTNRQVLKLDVTDAAGDTYLQKVTSTSGLTADDQYLIVYENGNTKYALTYTTSNNAHRTSVTITPEGNLYTIANAADNIKWTLTSNNGLKSFSNPGNYLSLYSNSYFFSTTDGKMVFSYNNGTFTIRRENRNYLRYSDGFVQSGSNSTGFVIYKIVDAPAPPTYWIPVSEITDIDANYLIVNNTSGYAVGLNAYKTPANMTAVEGHTGVYSTTLGDQYWWKFSAAGNSSYQTNVSNPSYGIRLKNGNQSDPVGTDMTTNTLAYSNGYWTMSHAVTDAGRSANGTYYLHYYNSGDKITSSTDTNAPERRQTIIYKQVTAPDREHASLIGTGGNQGNTGENYINLFDDDTSTKYCVQKPANNKVTVYFQTEDSRPFIADSYALTTANDNQEYNGRLPDGWILYGSNDQNNWTILDRVTDPGMEAVNFTEYEYDIDNPIGYTYYKIEFDVSNMIQFSELQLFGEYGGGGGDVAPGLVDKAPDHHKYIDAFRDDADNPDTDLDDRARNGELEDDIFDLYRLYLDVGPEKAYQNLDVLFILDSSTSMSGYSGFDAKDILGYDSWRCWALDTLLNGEPSNPSVPGKTVTNNENQHQRTLYNNGLIKKITDLSPNNKIAVARFSPSYETRLSRTIPRSLSCIQMKI